MSARRLGDALLLAAPLIVFALLAAFVLADPAAHITASNGPNTDEAWDVINARNFVLLGRWSTDDWNLHLVNVPYSAVQAIVFSVAGVGMAQARFLSIAAVALTMTALGFGLRKPLGTGPALLASLAYGTSTLVLFYGRLAFLEPSVALGLTVGGLLSLRAGGSRSAQWGAVAGLALALAIGTKPSAAFAAAGLLVGLAVASGRSGAVRRWLLGALVTVAVAGIAWIVVIGLPNREAVATDLRIWASEPIIGSLHGMARLILTFPFRNDGFVVLAAPVIAFGVLGWLAAAAEWRRLAPVPRGLLGAATGWLLVGLGLLAVAPYRPNRYEVPLLPAFAILGAIGCSVMIPRVRARAPRVLPVGAGVVVAVLVLPGLLFFGSWIASATYHLPDIQARVAAIVPAGDVVQGDYAPAFALRAPVVTLVSRPPTRVNPGDLYVTRGVRWFVGPPGSAPAWAGLHPAAWAARTEGLCAPWAGTQMCLWHLP